MKVDKDVEWAERILSMDHKELRKLALIIYENHMRRQLKKKKRAIK